MAEILNYIARQINNLTDTISDNDTLKSVGLYEIVNFIAEKGYFFCRKKKPTVLQKKQSFDRKGIFL